MHLFLTALLLAAEPPVPEESGEHRMLIMQLDVDGDGSGPSQVEVELPPGPTPEETQRAFEEMSELGPNPTCVYPAPGASK